MLNWSETAYKLTLGMGSLGAVALLGELSHDAIPAWAAVVIVMLPFVLFLFVQPGVCPSRWVQFAQNLASLWFLLLTGGLCVALLFVRPLPRGWYLCVALALPGVIPCAIVLWRSMFGTRARRGARSGAQESSGSASTM